MICPMVPFTVTLSDSSHGVIYLGLYVMYGQLTRDLFAIAKFLLPPTKEEVNAYASVCLSVCLLARFLKNACMDLAEMLRVDRCRDMDELINF